MDRLKPLNDRKCTIDGCENRGNIRHGFCNLHYRRWRRHGDPLGGGPMQDREKWVSPVTEKPERQCSVAGCTRTLLAQGLCSAHYGRWQRWGDPLGGGPDRKPASEQGREKCFTEGCGKHATTKGFCCGHYARLMKGGDTTTPLTRQNISKPYSMRMSSGYIVHKDRDNELAGSKNGYVLEHREVMSKKLGRLVRKDELVHHINGKRDDNRPENLELFYKGHPPGQRPEDLVAWAYEIIALYAEEIKPKLKLVVSQ